MRRKKGDPTANLSGGVVTPISTEAGEEMAELFKQRPIEGDPDGGYGGHSAAALEAEMGGKGTDQGISLHQPGSVPGDEDAPEPAPIGPEPETIGSLTGLGEEGTEPNEDGEEFGSLEDLEIKLPEGETGEAQGETSSLPRIETHTEAETLKCLLTEEEIKAAGDLMARADGERVDAEATLKSVSAQYKAKIASAEAMVGAEASKIRSGYEFRPVEVRVEFDHERGTVERFRTDTFEMIEGRRMTTFEAQRKIRF